MKRGFLIVLAMLLVGAEVTSGRTWYVDVNGTPGMDCDCTEIQAGIDSAAASDTVLVAPGVYSEEIVIKSGTSVISEGGPDVTSIVGSGGYAVVTTEGNCDRATRLQGFEIAGPAGQYGANWRGGGLIKGNVFGSPLGIAVVAGSYQITLGRELDVVENRITGCGYGIFNGGKSHHLNILRNVFVGCSSTAIELQGWYWYDAPSAYIYENLMVECGSGISMYMYLSTRTSIEFNTIFGCQHGGIGANLLEGPLDVYSNIVCCGAGCGIGIYTDDDAWIECNDVWDNDGGNYCDQGPSDFPMSECPSFCNVGTLDFHLCDESPCLPENNEMCGRIGAFGQGCICGPTDVGFNQIDVPLVHII